MWTLGERILIVVNHLLHTMLLVSDFHEVLEILSHSQHLRDGLICFFSLVLILVLFPRSTHFGEIAIAFLGSFGLTAILPSVSVLIVQLFNGL